MRSEKKIKKSKTIFLVLYCLMTGILLYFFGRPLIKVFSHPEPFGYLQMAYAFTLINIGVTVGPFFLGLNIWGIFLHRKLKVLFITISIAVVSWIIYATIYLIKILDSGAMP